MPTLEEFASDFASLLRRGNVSPTIVHDVANSIRNLTYTESGKPISDEDIKKIIKEMEIVLGISRSTGNMEILKEAEDSSQFITMIKLIREELRKR